MSTTPEERHASDSSEQRAAESEILAALERLLGVRLDQKPAIDLRVDLDGFSDGETPVCVEVWAHQGRAKGAQSAKVMRDFCKLLLVQKLLGKPCRLVFGVCDERAVEFLKGSWMGRFAHEHGIESIVATISEETCAKVREAQRRQYR